MSVLSPLLEHLAPTPRMPALFVGHGSPMNAIEDNEISRNWRKVGDSLPMPRAILVVSAHWMTRGVTMANVSEKPRTIHDFGGFPDELFAQQYPAPGAPDIAAATLDLLRDHHTAPDEKWGLDHGAWSVLIKMFPKADIPVFQVSMDMTRSLEQHFDLGRDLKALRERGVMIVNSGNVVHNLRTMSWGAKPFDFTLEFDSYIAKAITERDDKALLDVSSVGRAAAMAHPSVDHYLPILYTAAVRDGKDEISQFNEIYDLGSISMRSFIYQ